MADEITTIFVVGFPDDMKEREFQNMFTFSPGFEAATLKVPGPEESIDKDGNLQKKQIIGFAKFHTRLEALEARDILTGRKVDADKNCVLKAEMAKKNLHTKRGLSSLGALATGTTATFGLDSPSTVLSGYQQVPMTAGLQTAGLQTAGLQTPLAPSALLASRPEKLRIASMRSFNPFNDGSLQSAPVLGNGRQFQLRQDQYTSAFAEASGGFYQNELSALESANSSAAPTPHPAGRRGSVHGALAEEAPKPKQGARPVLDLAALQPHLNSMHVGAPKPPGSALSIPYSALASAGLLGPTTPGLVLPMATTRSVNSNDQNPPCNTLYVGNLPVGASEEELKLVFRNAPGYKRMSFRTKPNSGPMCFVEFEAIDYATLAMHELDGRKLSSSVGGGIRLSYSKNPLGVRSQAHSAYPYASPINPSFGVGSSPSPTASSVASQGTPKTPAASVDQPSSAPSPTHSISAEMPPKDALSFLHQPIHQLHKQAKDTPKPASPAPGAEIAASE
ncbi:hypothetical protein EC988_001508 [Linderina pennispora]|nr:hypothetical protein EC988_001508 [Linderina pennispora]